MNWNPFKKKETLEEAIAKPTKQGEWRVICQAHPFNKKRIFCYAQSDGYYIHLQVTDLPASDKDREVSKQKDLRNVFDITVFNGDGHNIFSVQYFGSDKVNDAVNWILTALFNEEHGLSKITEQVVDDYLIKCNEN